MNVTPFHPYRSRFQYAFGVGVDYYSINVSNHFDIYDMTNGMVRFTDTTFNKFGLLLRAGLEYYIVKDVSIQFILSGRLVEPIEIQAIEITHPVTNDHWRLANHSVNMSSFYLSTGIGMHF